MRSIASLAGLAGALTLALSAAWPAHAADAASLAQKAERVRTAQCTKEAGDKSGAEHEAFMTQCLAQKKAEQQAKVKACRDETSDKAAGADRKTAMRECLRAKAGG